MDNHNLWIVRGSILNLLFVLYLLCLTDSLSACQLFPLRLPLGLLVHSLFCSSWVGFDWMLPLISARSEQVEPGFWSNKRKGFLDFRIVWCWRDLEQIPHLQISFFPPSVMFRVSWPKNTGEADHICQKGRSILYCTYCTEYTLIPVLLLNICSVHMFVCAVERLECVFKPPSYAYRSNLDGILLSVRLRGGHNYSVHRVLFESSQCYTSWLKQ